MSSTPLPSEDRDGDGASGVPGREPPEERDRVPVDRGDTHRRRTSGRGNADRHLIGHYAGDGDGPLLLAVGGLHGNEPSGVEALRRVVRRLARHRSPLRGHVVALAGNRAALSRRRRYLDEDLNRIWTLDRIAALRRAMGNGGPPEPSTAEGREQAELLSAIHAVLDEAGDTPVYFLDLHTTSSESVPFLTFSDSLRNRAFASHFPLPLVLGMEEEVEGTLLDYVDHLGHVTLGVEGGSHRDPGSVEHLEAVVWLALVAAGCLELAHVPEADGLRDRLARAVEEVPSLFEVRYRHGLRDGDEFRMEDGFRNFQAVDAGQPVARDRRGEVRAPESGRIFLPLYQDQGDEGFFIVRRVAPFWLKVSALLRRLGADRAARWLPGVELHPDREETLVVHPRVAGRLTLKLFHLLGYRRERSEGGRLVLSRRKDAVEGDDDG